MINFGPTDGCAHQQDCRVYRVTPAQTRRWIAALVVFVAVSAHVASAKSKAPASVSSAGITAAGSDIHLTFTNPKTGVLVWKATARSVEARTGSTSASTSGALHGVAGTMYQQGVPADAFAAPTVSVDQSARSMVASGGVHIHSLAKSGAAVSCDTITWHYDSNMVIGTGNVIYRQSGFAQNGPSFQADTRLKTILMPAPGFGGWGHRTVSATMNFPRPKGKQGKHS